MLWLAILSDESGTLLGDDYIIHHDDDDDDDDVYDQKYTACESSH
jgi:hypothetical protein